MKKVFTIVSALILAAPLGASPARAALIEPLKVSTETSFPAPRWMFDGSRVPVGKSLADSMAGIYKSQLDKDFAGCLRNVNALKAKTVVQASGLLPWLQLKAIDCAAQLKPSDKNEDLRSRALGEVDRHPDWLLAGAQAPLLRSATVGGLIDSLEQDIKTNRPRAIKSIERAQQLVAFSDEKQRAKLWYLAGELAFVTQKTEGAREFYLRSLSEVESDEVRARLNSVESALNISPEAKPGGIKQSPTPVASPQDGKDASQLSDTSDEERNLVERVTASMKSGDLLSGVADAVKLINEFPGGTRAKWASDRILECYFAVTDKSDDTVRAGLSRLKIIALMQSADGDRLGDWAKTMSARGSWSDALLLSQAALETIRGARDTQLLDLAAKSAMATDNFTLARKFFDRLILSSAGQPLAREALFRSGLLHYRKGEYVKAGTDFEKLLLNPQIGQFEFLTRYWYWRSLQKQGSNLADSVARQLMLKAPFSYYGLRARIELDGGLLEWKNDTRVFNSQMWLTETEKKTWNRILLLLQAGWLDEAGAEIKDLPPARKAEDRAVRALLWASSGNYVNATKLANEAWDENPELRKSPLVEAAFPRAFSAGVDAQADARGVDRYLVAGLIKQESGYNVKAVSPSNAMGLMQMIPPTARDIALDLHLGALTFPDDLFQPARNIKMGTFYLSKLLGKYQSNVPLALAAYNAGPARIDRWIKSRPSLQKIQTLRSSAPDDEVWFDEIPYWETSIYVKAILRNILIYRMLDVGRVNLSDPLWATQNPSPPADGSK